MGIDNMVADEELECSERKCPQDRGHSRGPPLMNLFPSMYLEFGTVSVS